MSLMLKAKATKTFLRVRVGTFITSSTSIDVLNAVRQNYARFANRNINETKCSIRHSFFVGSTEYLLPDLDTGPFSGDIIQGFFPENMNSGKSFSWLVTALERFPRLDFLFKSDTDTAVNLPRLCDALLKLNKTENVYVGKAIAWILRTLY